ncbi:YceI family protein [Flavobacterium silvaticum]|uniref:YceI family protein n=1 Tax=Flavobacterium silvaticum TaxID=1852020 RepID=A0A972FWB9_9FLAO|nr:YceI family protein [Flavobacterium silvaticum]NMH28835.1 YceI family protein [Flavobacterium silvaticum]
MNTKTSITYSILCLSILILGCKGPKQENNDNASSGSLSQGQKYSIDTTQTVVTWKGSNLVGSNSHAGYVHISKGELMIDNNRIVGGTAEIDMNTIEDENHERDNGLIKHLKGPDFFDVKKFPLSKIVLTQNAESRNITGNLTIRGITQPVSFAAKLETRDGIVNLSGYLAIDRTLWDVRYKSGKFYDNLADQTISDYIEFHIKIVAKK